MAKNKALSATDWHGALSDAALEAMRTYEDPKRDKDDLDGLAAAICILAAIGVKPPDWPDWVKDRLVMRSLKVEFSGTQAEHLTGIVKRRITRQNKLRRKMGIFENDLVRYVCIVMRDAEKNPARYAEMATFIKILNGQKLNRQESAQFTKPTAKKDYGRRPSNLFEDAFARIQHRYFAPEDSSGMKQSYYRVQRMFGKRLGNYVACRVVEALWSRFPVL